MRSESGQVALIALLISAVILTIGLSLSKKAVTETMVDTDEQALKEAFNMAESGLDYYLVTGNSTYRPEGTNSSAEIKVGPVGGQTTLDYGEMTMVNQPNFFWLVNHTSSGSLGTDYYSNSNASVRVCVGTSFNSSLKMDVFYVTGGVFGVKRYLANSFNNAICGIGKKGVVVDITADSLLLVVTPVGADGYITLQGTTNFPSQGEEIASVGKAEGGKVMRKVKIQRRYKIPWFLLDAVLASGSVRSN